MFKIGLENVQLKIKTVKSIRNRYDEVSAY